MYIVIIGAGNVGYHLAKAVLRKGHEVLLIDRDAATLERIEDELGSIGLRGDGCECQHSGGGGNRQGGSLCGSDRPGCGQPRGLPDGQTPLQGTPDSSPDE